MSLAMFGDASASLPSSTYLLWYLVYGVLFVLFYIFSSPFTGNRELRKSWTGYVYFSTILYVWLGMAVAFHLPILAYDVRVPVSLFSPLFLASVLALFLAEGLCKVANRYFVFHIGFRAHSLEVVQNAFVVSLACCLVYSQCGSVSNEGLTRKEWLLNTVSDVTGLGTGDSAHSIASMTTPATEGTDGICYGLFSGHVNSRYAHLPMVLVLWCTAISALVVNFLMERISPFRGMFSEHLTHKDKEKRAAESSPSVSSTGLPATLDISSAPARSTSPASSYKLQLKKIRPSLFKDMMDPPMLEMVPWYALMTSFTGVDMLIHLKLFVGRFDQRTLQAVTPNSFHYTPPLYPGHVLTGGGFTSSNSLNNLGTSAHCAGVNACLSENTSSADVSPVPSPTRVMAGGILRSPPSVPTSFQQAHHVHQHHMDAPLVYDHCAEDSELWFDWMSDCGDGWNSSYQICRVLAQPTLEVKVRRKGGRKSSTLHMPRGKMLVLGGDLAYPSPNADTYETRFFRPFQCAMPPPLNYDPSALSMHKPPIPGGVAGLKDYKGPTCFAIPGNHDWFDGLQTYLRYVCCRDWLGGWLMPQERSFFALQLPQGWWLFGLDNALSDDIDAQQFKYFASIIERMDEDDRVIIATHEPGWIIDTHDQRSTGENTAYLIKILKGKVALRMAGDIHNYTRHMPSPLIPGRTSIQTKVQTAFASSALSSLCKGVLDTVFRDRSENDDETVSGVVDATISRTLESARQQADELTAAKSTEVTSYYSMLYSRFTSFGGSGDGVFLEDIESDLDPSLQLLRTQSLPTMPASHTASRSRAGSDLGLDVDDTFALEPPALTSTSARKHPATEGKAPQKSSSMPTGKKSDKAKKRLQFAAAPSHTAPLVDWSAIHDSSSPLARSSPLMHTIRSWSVDEVLDWLSSVGVHDGATHASFSSAEVDGKLLVQLELADLLEIGIASQIKRKKIFGELTDLISRSANEEDEAATEEPSKDASSESESEGSETEQLTRDILSGSTLDLTHDHREPGGAISDLTSLPEAPPSVTNLVRAASGPEMTSLPHEEVAPGAVFLRRNVDPTSMAHEEPLTLENAVNVQTQVHVQQNAAEKVGFSHVVQAAVAAAAVEPAVDSPLTVTVTPAAPTSPPTTDGETSANGSASKRSKRRKKGSAENLAAKALNPRSGEAIVAPIAVTPRQNESLFGASAVGANVARAMRSAAGRSPSRSPSLRTPSRSPVLRPMSALLQTNLQTNLYNNTASAPIPTDLKETINVAFPEGSAAPQELRDMELERERDAAEAAAAGEFMDPDNSDGLFSATSAEHVRPPPVLIVSGGGGAFMHPTHVPDPEPILYRGNRYVRASSYPPVALSRAYALLNLFGFRRQNWRFDMFGGVLYFLFAFSVLPVCNLAHVLDAASWYDAVWQYVLAVLYNYGQVFTRGYVSLGLFFAIWVVLMCFGEVPWPWYKRLLVGSLHAIAHQLAAISALVLMETMVELGVARKILGQGEVLYLTFVRNFPLVAAAVDQADVQCYGVFGMLARFVSNVFDVPDNLAHYKQYMCNDYDSMSRRQLLIYYFNAILYLWVLVTPLVSFMFGAYLYIGSAFLNAHYTEAFSSLRIEGFKNIVRMHINARGDLEIYTLGVDRVPSKWTKDAKWSGHRERGDTPSYEWETPSVLKQDETDKVSAKDANVKLIDYLLINKNPRNKSAFARNAAAQATANVRSQQQGVAPLAPSPPATSMRNPSIRNLMAPETDSSRRGSLAATPIPSPTDDETVSAGVALAAAHSRQLSKSSVSLHPLIPTQHIGGSAKKK